MERHSSNFKGRFSGSTCFHAQMHKVSETHTHTHTHLVISIVKGQFVRDPLMVTRPEIARGILHSACFHHVQKPCEPSPYPGTHTHTHTQRSQVTYETTSHYSLVMVSKLSGNV